jgi:threonine/homoserine/homoserine lactone efflux protein
MTPVKAFLFGAGVLLIAPKFWVFTLGAISVIGEADLGRRDSIVTYLLFVLVASALNVTIVLVAFLVPTRSAAWLDGASGWLTRHNRVIVTVVSLVFGTWFLIKALKDLGIL